MQQVTNDFLGIAILEAKGILTAAEAEVLSFASLKVTPVNYESAQSLVADALMDVDSWDTCEICRRVMYDWRAALSSIHRQGHPEIDSSE